MPVYLRRLAGALTLDSSAYEDVEADGRATMHAAVTVLLSSLAAGIGLHAFGGTYASIAPLSVFALLAWASWSLLTFEVGARLLPGARTHADVGELLRTLGFATSPGLLLVVALTPGLAVPVFVMVALWMLVAMVIAVRQALDYTSTLHAVAVCVVGWLLALAMLAVGGLLFATRVSGEQRVERTTATAPIPRSGP
jgi:hypothetical protein